MSDDLVKRGTRAMMQSEPWSSFWGRADAEKLARAAIAVALEEAAKVCDAMEEEAERRARKMYNGDMWLGESAGCAKAAAAIRALIPKEA